MGIVDISDVAFDSVDVGPEEFREVLYQAFPQLRRGGYQLFKCVANRTLEPLFQMVYSSPKQIKSSALTRNSRWLLIHNCKHALK